MAPNQRSAATTSSRDGETTDLQHGGRRRADDEHDQRGDHHMRNAHSGQSNDVMIFLSRCLLESHRTEPKGKTSRCAGRGAVDNVRLFVRQREVVTSSFLAVLRHDYEVNVGEPCRYRDVPIQLAITGASKKEPPTCPAGGVDAPTTRSRSSRPASPSREFAVKQPRHAPCRSRGRTCRPTETCSCDRRMRGVRVARDAV